MHPEVSKATKRYSRVPEPTSLDINRRAISNYVTPSETPFDHPTSPFAKLAKRVSSLQESIFQPRQRVSSVLNSKKRTESIKIPQFEKKDLTDVDQQIPIARNIQTQEVQAAGINMMRKLQMKYKPLPPGGDSKTYLTEVSIDATDAEKEDDDDDDQSIGANLIDMTKHVYINDDHLSVELDTSSMSVMSSLLNRYSDLSATEAEDYILPEITTDVSSDNVLLASLVKFVSSTDTAGYATKSENTQSIFSYRHKNILATPQSYEEADDELSINEIDQLLPTEIYNSPVFKSPIDQFQIRDYNHCNDKVMIENDYIPPPVPKHQYNVTPSSPSVYYTCQSGSGDSACVSARSSVYSAISKRILPRDYTDARSLAKSEPIMMIPHNRNQSTEIFTRKHQRNVQSLTTSLMNEKTKNYLEKVQINPSLLSDDIQLPLKVMNP